mgnify:CR=1 FL=1
MKNFIRNFLGIRKKRRGLPSGPVPLLGASLIRGRLKMKVNEPVTEELWHWMLLLGWRANNVQNDRRSYTNLPGNALALLIAAGPDTRESVHARLINSAKASQD